MTTCPELSVLEHGDAAAHALQCASCRIVIDLLGERRRGRVERDRRNECERFELLLAAREEGTIGGTAGELLDAHLRACPDCTLVANTLAPNDPATTTALPAVSTAAYALGREVARGGMGRILAAEDLRIGRPVAVKELLGKSPALAARFEREARVTARLQHPGIVPIYEIGTWPDGTPFYTMRMVEGATLREALRDKPALDDRLALLPAIIAAAEAVAFAHGKRIIHRDLTPNNILVGAYGDTVVIDWGLAKDLSEPTDDVAIGPYRDEPVAAELTRAGAVVGTAAYMPPEQARGEPVDERADVYALGAILYHLLAGNPPYHAPRSDDVLRLVQASAPSPIGDIAPGTPRDLLSIVDKAIDRDPAARYAHAGELAQDLRRFQTGRLVEAHHYSPRERLRRWARHRRAYVIAATASIVALSIAGTIGLAGVLRERDRAELGEREATRQQVSAETSAALLLEDSGRHELLTGHPVRAAVWLSASYSAGNQRPALRFLLARAMRDLEAREHELTCDGALGRPDVSPDEKTVLAPCGSAVQLWRVVDGALVSSLKTPGITWAQAAFSHDGRAVVAWSGAGDVRIGDPTASAFAVSLVGHTDRIFYASFSKDDTKIVTSSADRTVRVWSVVSGKEILRLDVDSAPPGAIRAMFVGDGYDLVSSGSDGVTSVWNGQTGKLVGQIPNGSLIVSTDRRHNTLDRSLTCGADGVARVWDVSHARLVVAFAAHADVIWTCTFSPDRARLLTTSSDGTAKLWDIASGRLLQAVNPGGVVNAGAFSPDGRRIVTGVLGSGVQVWDAETGALLGADDGAGIETDGLRVVGDRIFAVDGSTLRVWNHLGDRAAIRRFHAPPGMQILDSGDFTGDWVVLASASGDVTVWDVALEHAVPHIALRTPIASNRRRLAARTAEGIGVVSLIDGSNIATLPMAGSITQLALSADGRRLLVTGDRGTGAWDLATGVELAHWDEDWRVPALSADGELVVAWRRPLGAQDPHAEIWRLSPAGPIQTLATGRDVIREAHFSRDNARLVTKMGEQWAGAISIWDIRTGHRVRVIPDAIAAHLDASMERIAIRFSHHHEIWRIADATSLATVPDIGFAATTDVTADGAFVGAVEAGSASYVLLDASDGRVLESIPAPRTAVVTAESFNIGTGPIAFSADSSSVVVATVANAMWLKIDREDRPPGEIARIVASRARWRLDGIKLVEKTGTRTTLRGTVTRLGKPVAGATVKLSLSPAPGGSFTVLSAADGTFRVDDLPVAAITVDAVSGSLGAFTRPHAVTLSAADNHVELELDLDGSIEGRVLDAHGEPVVGIEVFANCHAQNDSGDAVTDRDGRFRIVALSGGGTYELKPHRFQTLVAADVAPVPLRDGNHHVTGVEIHLR